MKQNIPFCNLQLDEAFKLSIMEYIAWIGGGGGGSCTWAGNIFW